MLLMMLMLLMLLLMTMIEVGRKKPAMRRSALHNSGSLQLSFETDPFCSGRPSSSPASLVACADLAEHVSVPRVGRSSRADVRV